MNKLGKILEKVIRASKKSREWRSFVYFLAAVVVFTTTYALILPAITVEKSKTDSVGGLVVEEADPDSMGAGAENPEDMHTVTAENKKSDEAVQKETVPEEAAGNTEAAEEEREPYNGEVLTIGDRYIMTLTGEEFDVVVSSDLSAGVSRGTTLSVRGVPDPDVAKSYSDRISDELLKSFVDTKSTEILYQLVFTDEDFFEYTPTGRFDVEFIFHNNTVGSDGEMIYAPRFDGGKVYAAIYDYLTDEMILAEKNGDEYETPVILLDENGVLRSITLKGLDFYEYSDVITLVGGPVNEELKLAAETAESSGKTKSEESSEEAKKSPEKKETGSGTLNARGSDYSVTLAYSAEAEIPDNAVLEVTEIGTGTDVYMQYLEQAKAALGLDKDQALPQEQARFFDIRIMVDGKEIQPAANVNVNIAYDAPVVGSDPRTDSQVDVSAVHFGKEGAEVVEVGDADDRSVKFEAESFSIYGVIYTVDFEYSVNGKMYQFSLPGGGFVSFTDLVEVLGITGDTNSEEDGDENGSVIAGNAGENVANEGAEENGINSVTNTVITLGDVEVSEATRKFVADVASVEFSSPELVDVSKVEEDTTVGQIKDSRGLECEYSAELTEEQIAEINAQTVEAGDWALISVQPFTSEETLTVTMKNGDQFVVKVTDAQISTNVLTADGEHFRITVNYEDDANIPKGSVLVAEEIPEGSENYEKYLKEALEKWEQDNKEGYISFCRFFDIEIQKNGKKVEPETAVEVEIVHEDGLAFFDDEELSVIHFAQNGTEIIEEIQRNKNNTEVIYEQEGFSVIGTISNVKNSGWPTNNGQHVLILQDGDTYYALKHDGTLTKVRYFNETVSFIGEGTTTTDYINDYLWYVTSNQGSNATGRVSDAPYSQGDDTTGISFICPTETGWKINTARQIRMDAGSHKLYYSFNSVARTLSADNGELSVVPINSENASPLYFANASTFSANSNETDLFTQEEVDSIISMWQSQMTKGFSTDKTAEVQKSTELQHK